MALTILEAAVENGSQSTLEVATVRMFEQMSPVLRYLPMVRIDGRTYPYNREQTLPGIGWRAVNQTWPESTGIINPYVERLMILGGEVKIDRFLLDTQPAGSQDLKRRQYEMKVQAASNEFDRAFLEGDDLVDPNQMVGLRRRLSGAQVLNMGDAALTLDALDQLLDLVPFSDNKYLWVNRTVRRKITALENAATGARRITLGQDEFGKQVEKYGDAIICIVEQSGDGSTYLDYDEDPGDTQADTASIYVTAFGENRLHGIYNGKNGKVLTVEDMGEQQAEPRVLGRMEFYPGIAIEHPRAAARLRGILNA